MLKLLTEAITEESTGYYRGVNRLLLIRKQTLVQADAIQCTYVALKTRNCQRKFGFTHQDAS